MTAVSIRSTQELITLALALGKPQENAHPYGRRFVLLPQGDGGAKLEYLERPDLPTRKTGTVETLDVESFLVATNRYYDAKCGVVYAAIDPGSFVAVLNDHHHDGPNWRDHRVSFALSFSKEFKLWDEQDKEPMTQEEFAFFIEDNMPDFTDPPGARMLEVAINFRVTQGAKFSKALRLTDGTVSLEFTEQNTVNAGSAGTLSVPEKFRISIPVWAGLDQKSYDFDAVLRWTLRSGDLAIRYELQRPHKVVEDAFAETLQTIKDGIPGATVIFGKP